MGVYKYLYLSFYLPHNAFRQVYQARNKINGEIVALKKVRMDNEKEGVCISVLNALVLIYNHNISFPSQQ